MASKGGILPWPLTGGDLALPPGIILALRVYRSSGTAMLITGTIFIALLITPVHVSHGLEDNRSFNVTLLGYLEVVISVDRSTFQRCYWYCKPPQRV